MDEIKKGIRDIAMGHLVRLVRKKHNTNEEHFEEFSVAGYVIGGDSQAVMISYQNPRSPDFDSDMYHTSFFGRGDRFFRWKKFTHY